VDARYIALAVPFFFVLIGGEILLNLRRAGDARYELHDSISSLSSGVGQQLLAVFFKFAEVGGYYFVWKHLRVATISMTSPVAWAAILIGVDLGYYWYHRLSHRINFLWATHAVHHQSEEYNLSTALRQSWFTGLTSWIFYAPLAVLGFPTPMFLGMHTINTLYQFWIHTRSVGKMGFLETFLNTPSHHRVHHGTNPRYIDKNYAGIFIFWDMLFGTFVPEADEPVYGLVKPLASFNPVWANVEPFVRLAKFSAQARGIDKVYVWLAPPEWRPSYLGGDHIIPEVSRSTQHKYEVSSNPRVDAYVLVSFALAVAFATAILWYESTVPAAVMIGPVAMVVLGLLAWGGLVEHKPWAPAVEGIRLAMIPALAATATWGTRFFVLAIALSIGLAGGFGLWLASLASGRKGHASLI
jgi:sterol desaturase/sphingolipid hydroxylase (fatty acid hydroxylase superfamily)